MLRIAVLIRTMCLGVLVVGFGGCGGSSEEGPSAPGKPTTRRAAAGPAESAEQGAQAALEGPAAAVYEFLEAIRTGDDQKATQMLSETARRRWAEKGVPLSPPASDTARFSVGAVEYVGQDGARVAATWTDLDENRQPRTDHALWMVRREASGWRIVGVAATVFEGEPPLLLDFENPDEVLRKQQWVEEELRRRAWEAELQARRPENSQDSTRR